MSCLFGTRVLFSEGGMIIACAHTLIDLHKFKVTIVYHAKIKEVRSSLNITYTSSINRID